MPIAPAKSLSNAFSESNTKIIAPSDCACFNTLANKNDLPAPDAPANAVILPCGKNWWKLPPMILLMVTLPLPNQYLGGESSVVTPSILFIDLCKFFINCILLFLVYSKIR